MNAKGGRGSSARHRGFWGDVYDPATYQQLPWFRPEASPSLVRAVEGKFLPPHGRTLDLGCGAGSNVLYLARGGFESHGVDLSPGAVEISRQRAVRESLTVNVRVGDALALDFPRATFDAVTDIGCFHTLPIRRRLDYSREVARVLRPGGAFLLSWVGRERSGSPGPPHRPSLEEVTHALEDRFLFLRTTFDDGSAGRGFGAYDAWLVRRAAPRPPRR